MTTEAPIGRGCDDVRGTRTPRVLALFEELEDLLAEEPDGDDSR